MTAGLATITKLLEPGCFDNIQANTADLVEREFAARRSKLASHFRPPTQAPCLGSIFSTIPRHRSWITPAPKACADVDRYGSFFHAMLERGVYLAPSQFEAAFMSSAHSAGDIDDTLRAAAEALALL